MKKKETNIEPKLSKLQREILVGKLLGDAWLETQDNEKTYRFGVEQSIKQENYVQHLFDLFHDFLPQKCKLQYREKAGRKNPEEITTNVRFRTKWNPCFRFYAHQFYQKVPPDSLKDSRKKYQKRVPRLIHKWLTPRALAYWYMDDGSMKSKQHKAVRLNTQGFEHPGDIDLLVTILQSKFGLKAHRMKSNQIEISGSSYETLRELIFPYLLPEMHYKFPSPRISRQRKRKVENLEKLESIEKNHEN